MPKALAPLAGRTVLHWSVAAAARAPSVREIVVAAPAGRLNDTLRFAREAAGDRADVRAVEGGAERAQSVASALAEIGQPIVAVHDAARPLISTEAFESLVAIVAASDAAGAILATPVFDTIKRATDASEQHPAVAETVDRREMWAAQTPQVFSTETLREAYGKAGARAPEATDEAMLVEWAGGQVLLVPGSGPNFKLTSVDDVALAEALLAGV